MRLITRSTVTRWAKQTPVAASFLLRFMEVSEAQAWENLVAVRRTYPHADAVTVAGGRTVTIFNVGKTGYRLLTAIDYNGGRVFMLRLMSHAEYDKQLWKEQL